MESFEFGSLAYSLGNRFRKRTLTMIGYSGKKADGFGWPAVLLP
jgi:hypothetical protein